MTRIRAAGLALIAVFAVSAVAASGAQAGLKVTAASYPAVLTGTVIQHKAGETEPVHIFTVGEGKVSLTCKKTSFVSTITAATETLTVIPSYKECTAIVGVEKRVATVTMEDCDYVFHGGVKEVEVDKFEKGEVDLKCPTGKQIVVHVYKSATEETPETLCQLTIAPFVNKGTNTYINTTGTPDDIDIISSISGIPVVRDGSILCGNANQEATYTGSTTLKAFVDEGKATPENGTLTEIKEGAQIGLTVSE